MANNTHNTGMYIEESESNKTIKMLRK